MASSAAKGKGRGVARAIKSDRDYRAAAGVVKKLAGQPNLAEESEQRLRALIREMDKFEEPADDGDDLFDETDYGGPLRRWSDDGSGPD
jgi:hypothetical protein